MMQKVCGVIVLIFLSCLSAFGEGNCDVPSKKAQKKFDKLQREYAIRKTEIVIEIKELLEKYPDFVEGYYFLADHYKRTALKTLQPNKQDKLLDISIGYYKKVAELCPEFAGHFAYYWLGILNHKEKKDIKTAAEYFQKYLDNELEPPKKYAKRAQDLADEYFVKQELLKNPVSFDPRLVKGVSSPEDEYLPMLSPDNEKLYFTRKRNSSPDRTQPQKLGNDNKEWFSMSRKMSVDSFSYGMVLKAPFNVPDIKGDKLLGLGGICLTPDNKTMFVTAVTLVVPKRGNGYKNTSLYYTQYIDGSWTPLKNAGPHINDENKEPTWEGQPTMSSDGKLVIFASARPSSVSFKYGDQDASSLDLFSIEKLPNGTWSEAKSLGEIINTPGHEKTPFLHTDSKTLYFASNGHPGMGGSDIFYTRMDENGYWTKPTNVGYPINTDKDEHGLMVSLDGNFAYMSSGKKNDGNGGLQIIHFPLHKEARPEKVVFMKGTLKDEEGKAVKNGKIDIKNQETGEVTSGLVDKETGEYVAILTVKDPDRPPIKPTQITLKINGEDVKADYGSKISKVNGQDEIIPPGAKVIDLNGKQAVLKKTDKIRKIEGVEVIIPKEKKIIEQNGKQVIVSKSEKTKTPPKQKFIISSSGDDMAFSTEIVEVEPDEIKGAKKIIAKPTKIQKAKKNQAIRLNDVNFSTSSDLLNGLSMDILDQLVSFLKIKSTMEIAIHGHTDNVGNPETNLKLSKDRAKSVMEYLIEQGIQASRLSFDGFGESKPKSSNSTDRGRSLNRRVEFVIKTL